MLRRPSDAATAACLSLLLEVSGNPKAGNVDREHNFEDLRYEQFLASSVGAYPAFLEVAEGKMGIGEGILMAVRESMKWHRAENVHFGAFLLLVPLVSAWRAGDKDGMANVAVENLKRTDYEDSLRVLDAFKLAKARVIGAEKMNLQSSGTEREIAESGVNIYGWMKLAPGENLIAKELTDGYPISLAGADFILSSDKDPNETIVSLYHSLLSRYPDPLIIAKKGFDYAKKIMEYSKNAAGSPDKIRALDERLLKDGANPGTIADLTASSIYLAIVEGWRV
ncbi:triphosphoribosyl-dephospho-CoA synthase [Archaeoglobus neptunius]|uniref:triphosphoribosyl-dephospho-CoA synthase n=1 Tax=Archaeoglobus neptunius TaxID=2798580 RepID=UPI001926DA10|nr:triphosphoribosyl-dephospho-CoA synthase [Archaeoglobus neptunius]